MTTDTPTNFSGFYNNWGNGIAIHGWIVAKPNVPIEDIEVEAHLQGVVIGRVAIGSRHADGRAKFLVACEPRFRPIDILAGRLKLYAIRPDASSVELFADDSLLTWMAKVAFNETIFDHIRDIPSAKFILERIEARFGPSLANGRGVETPVEPVTDPRSDITPLLHRVGTISADRTAILGRAGTILLYEGSNRLFTQYHQQQLEPGGEALVAQWADIIGNRVRLFRHLGIPFVQTIIPEKSSVLRDFFPVPIQTPTRLLAAVESWAKDQSGELGACFVSAMDALTHAEACDQLFLKTDSHFAARGAMVTARFLLKALAHQHEAVAQALPIIDALMERAVAPEIPRRLVIGDLATRFFGVPLYDEDLDVTPELLFGRQSSVKLIDEVAPPVGNLNGLRMVWQQPDAPLDLRVLAFGNSFFERGSACTNLSWWFKHLCREFHFVWSKDIDRQYIEQIAPDVVIAQTIERFLTVVPQF